MNYKNIDSRVEKDEYYSYKRKERLSKYRIEKSKTYEDVEYTLVSNSVYSPDKEKKIVMVLVGIIVVLSFILLITNSNKHIEQSLNDNSEVMEETTTDDTDTQYEKELNKTVVESNGIIQVNHDLNIEKNMINKSEGYLLEKYKLKVEKIDTYSNIKSFNCTNSKVISTYIS